MKKNKVILSIILLSFLNNYSQITKNNWLIGGNGNLSFVKYEEKNSNNNLIINNNSKSESFEILLEPNIGYFIKDKFAVGLKIGFANAFNKEKTFQINQTQFSISPFVRYYFLEVDKDFNVFIEPSYYRFSYKSIGEASQGYGLKFGHVYFLNSSVGFETSLNYQYRESDQNKTNSMFIGFGFQLYLEKN